MKKAPRTKQPVRTQPAPLTELSEDQLQQIQGGSALYGALHNGTHIAKVIIELTPPPKAQ